MAGSGGEEGMEADGEADGAAWDSDGDWHGGFCGILPGVCQVEGSGGIYFRTWGDHGDAFRVLPAGPAGVHCADLPEDHEPVLWAVRAYAFFPEPDCGGCRGG